MGRGGREVWHEDESAPAAKQMTGMSADSTLQKYKGAGQLVACPLHLLHGSPPLHECVTGDRAKGACFAPGAAQAIPAIHSA